MNFFFFLSFKPLSMRYWWIGLLVEWYSWKLEKQHSPSQYQPSEPEPLRPPVHCRKQQHSRCVCSRSPKLPALPASPEKHTVHIVFPYDSIIIQAQSGCVVTDLPVLEHSSMCQVRPWESSALSRDSQRCSCSSPGDLTEEGQWQRSVWGVSFPMERDPVIMTKS